MRCAVYVRVSTDKEEQKASLTFQKDLFFHYISENSWELHDFYIDVESGTTAKREDLERLIDDAKQNKFDVILAKELSRLARNGQLSYEIKNLCESKGIHIITLDNAINTLTGDTRMFGLYAWIYEQESQHTSNRVKESLRSRARKGLFKGSSAPYGYEVKDGKLFIRDDETPDVVRRIYREYLKGRGRESIARELYNEDIPPPAKVAGRKNASDKWNDSTIRLILSNPHYVGDTVQGRTTTISVTNKKRKKLDEQEQIIVRNTHEAIISREDFEAVQAQFKVREKFITAPKLHLFTNIAYCNDCGTGMWYRSDRKSYLCGSYSKFGNKACSSHIFKEQSLIDVIKEDIHKLIEDINKDFYLQKLETKIKNNNEKIKKQYHKIENELKQFEGRKVKYINLLADEKISQDEYKLMIEKNNEQLNKLLIKKEELNLSIDTKDFSSKINMLKAQLSKFLEFEELTSDMLHRLIDRIDIKADGTPVIHYRFSLPHMD